VLPQGFTESPNLFGQALEQVLGTYQPDPQETLVQHVDGLLLAGQMRGSPKRKSEVIQLFRPKRTKSIKVKITIYRRGSEVFGTLVNKREQEIRARKGEWNPIPPGSEK